MTWPAASARAGEILRGLFAAGCRPEDVKIILRAARRQLEKMNVEQYTLRRAGRDVRVIVDHATCADILSAAGLGAPAIPAGGNTVQLAFRDAAGRAGLAVNQRGFTPEAGDDEREVNGLLVYLLQELPAPRDADDFLARLAREIEES